jgi:hypothetical protein
VEAVIVVVQVVKCVAGRSAQLPKPEQVPVGAFCGLVEGQCCEELIWDRRIKKNGLHGLRFSHRTGRTEDNLLEHVD